MKIRAATQADHDAVWALLEPVFRAGDTYAIDPDISREDALAYWFGPERRVLLAEQDGTVLGTYYIVRNQKGGGSHVCNCGYVTDAAARGQGVARAMLDHSLALAPDLGFRAMQFNFVVSTNTRAITIWERAGFKTVGRLPNAFHHPVRGDVDALVMFRAL
ncbi:GNAT family N-acetyltransferase [Lutimaribacter sp. EGI FJ00015]|uniref:GNAT family N-acetyltransferase n=1 Tax=Lutimaribacter degradans TaxID=2945989 RepID=A0ACC5ZV26_9RHOB|nr:N-acetyltransferase [Lutimaribacter sp. EGI FJ00013]MCM2561813.1 GNAT family N-acetyltransferase [Lutimaribacter sp. EGI FJ00013]MCO0613154.1 GNAT family N-acetyltransferase [Lutimaribacter sp. EGI FJ00015]MCO0635646.1 GNAT family N-acetyltransferase [Lutimaribacter sp. EGI FJ00014]